MASTGVNVRSRILRLPINIPNGIRICRNLQRIFKELVLILVLFQVLRYSALGAGIFYGFYHQAKLTTASKLAAIDREYERKQSLINQAKAEFTKKNAPASSKTSGGGTLNPGNDRLLSTSPRKRTIAIAVLDLSHTVYDATDVC